jgi:hypothetical protein
MRDIYGPLDLIFKVQGKHYHNLLSGQKDFGLISKYIEQICPCLPCSYEDNEVDIGVKYMNELDSCFSRRNKTASKTNKYFRKSIQDQQTLF